VLCTPAHAALQLTKASNTLDIPLHNISTNAASRSPLTTPPSSPTSPSHLRSPPYSQSTSKQSKYAHARPARKHPLRSTITSTAAEHDTRSWPACLQRLVLSHLLMLASERNAHQRVYVFIATYTRERAGPKHNHDHVMLQRMTHNGGIEQKPAITAFRTEEVRTFVTCISKKSHFNSIISRAH
jgi:hypothetical protein